MTLLEGDEYSKDLPRADLSSVYGLQMQRSLTPDFGFSIADLIF